MKQRIKLGTRGSPLAQRQTEMVRQALLAADPSLEIDTVIIKTSGDWQPAQGEIRLAEAGGGKGLFTKELEEALRARMIDAAVHSMKDMDSQLPADMAVAAMLPREDVRDVLFVNDLAKNNQNIFTLKDGAVVGTASVRRQAFLLHQRPDLKIVPLRGNVGTRLEKLAVGQVDATILAAAGLKRLGMADALARGQVLSCDDMLPCAGQGAVGVEILASRTDELAIFGQTLCRETFLCVTAERAALAALDGSCRSPIGALAEVAARGQDGALRIDLRLCVASLDGRQMYHHQREVGLHSFTEAATFGGAMGKELRENLPDGFLLRPQYRAQGGVR